MSNKFYHKMPEISFSNDVVFIVHGLRIRIEKLRQCLHDMLERSRNIGLNFEELYAMNEIDIKNLLDLCDDARSYNDLDPIYANLEELRKITDFLLDEVEYCEMIFYKSCIDKAEIEEINNMNKKLDERIAELEKKKKERIAENEMNKERIAELEKKNEMNKERIAELEKKKAELRKKN